MKKIFCKKHKTICHPGGFTDGRRVNECEPSPVSEQIEHTKTYQSGDYTPCRSDSEHTLSSQTRNDERFRMTVWLSAHPTCLIVALTRYH